MDRNEALRNYNWRALQARVHQWYRSRRLTIVEAPVASIDLSFGVEHCVPRASAMLIKLRYDADVSFVVLLTPAGLRAGLTSVRKMYRASTAWVATAAEIHHVAACIPGCMPAFGSLFELPVIIDPRLRYAPEIFAPSGRPGFAVRVPMADFSASEKPQFTDVTPCFVSPRSANHSIAYDLV